MPINPTPPGVFRRAADIKYLRTIATQLCYWPQLFRELRQADVVHVFSASYFSFLLAPLPAVLVAKLLGKPVVMNYRSGQAPDHLRRSAIARGTLRWVERNAVPSAFLQGVFREHGITAEVIPNIVDVDRFSFRKRQPLAPKILSTRNFEALYNVACTLRAFRLVQDRYPGGDARPWSAPDPKNRRLRALASELGLQNVHFVGRVPPEPTSGATTRDADIYLQTPDIDNMPSSVLEAFASGCAVVSTNAGGVPAILTDDRHGLLVECGDHAAAAERIIRLLEDPALVDRLTTAARESCAAVPLADGPLEMGRPLRRHGGQPRGDQPNRQPAPYDPSDAATVDRDAARGAPLPDALRAAQAARTGGRPLSRVPPGTGRRSPRSSTATRRCRGPRCCARH